MRLSLLSDGYLSDRINDAGPMDEHPRQSLNGFLHFAALCRGIAVLVALLVPLGLTLLARPAARTGGTAIIEDEPSVAVSGPWHANTRG